MKNKFWREQPVFHYYDLGYYWFPPGLIEKNLPKLNKFCNLKDITISSEVTQKHVQFIKENYLQNGSNTFSPTITNIQPYFEGHNHAIYISTYLAPDMLVDSKTQKVIETEKIIGMMTTRPLVVTMNGARFPVYYSDYLCVAEHSRGKGIAPQLIQTHEYIQRHKNKNIQISLFKREGEITASIVPLTIYNTVIYDTKTWKKLPAFPAYISLIECTKNNVQIFTDFLKENAGKFLLTCVPEIGNIISLLNSKNIFIYIVQKREKIMSAYFFKKTCTTIETKREILMCIASISCCENESFFMDGFRIATQTILNAFPAFQYVGIECISDNVILNKHIAKQYIKTFTSRTAYFWYNFAYPSFDSEKVFILN